MLFCAGCTGLSPLVTFNQGGANNKGHVTYPVSFTTCSAMTMCHSGSVAMLPRFWNKVNTGFDFTVHRTDGSEATAGADAYWVAIGF